MTKFEKLEALNNLIVGKLSESFVSLKVFTNETPFISFWHQPTPVSVPNYFSMKYLPLFYVIACLDQEENLSLKLITFHGKLVDEIKESNGELSQEEMINFVSKVSYLHLCQGVQLPDVQSKLDLRMFSSLYLLEHLEENVIIRSVQCNFALCPDDVVCDACAALSSSEYDTGKAISMNLQECLPIYDNSHEIQSQPGLNNLSNESKTTLPFQLESNDTDNGNEILLSQESKELVIYTDESNVKLKTPMTPSISSDQTLNENEFESTEIIGVEDNNIIPGPRHKTKVSLKGSKKLKSRKPHKCPQCTHTTRKRQHLKDHIRAIHEKARPFKCEHCTYAAATNSTIVKHMKIVHEKNLTVLCDRCDYKTSTNQNLLRHINTVHEKVKPFQCEKCSHATTTQRDLDAHVMAKHDKVKPIQCDQCEYTTCRKSSLNFHIKRAHDPNFKPEMCDKCEFVANSRGNLLRHMRTVHEKIKPYQCDHCEFVTGTKQTLVNHIRIKHDKAPKSFMCQHCSHKTASKGNLDIHIALSHSTTKPFKCKECNFETALKSHLKRHVTTVHEKIKPYPCPFCPYASNGNLQLQDHIRAIHEHVKGFFKCKWCTGDFNTRKARRRHVREAHPEVHVVKGEYNDC